MTDEAKKKLMLRFVLPLVIMLGLYYAGAVLYNQRGCEITPPYNKGG